MKKSSVIIIGASNQATSLTSIVLSLGIKILAMLMTKRLVRPFLIAHLSKNQFLNTYTNENLVIAIGDNAIREKVSLNTNLTYQMPISFAYSSISCYRIQIKYR